ncbi:hypothetical protein PLICRDRAFT_171044 [Plicaturopsis crispa FD-325 SS-3]|nr:hypothetical protein PLICRDRAFT_171044 [Plicaturopsis crispa FD-325 SS-3]
MPALLPKIISLAALAVSIGPAIADPTDWVNVQYAVGSKASVNQAMTSSARTSIINAAASTAKKGPWSVTNAKGYTAPSGDLHDYLSWAPYHWPNCNWCPRGKNHLASNSTGIDDGDGTGPDDDPDADDGDSEPVDMDTGDAPGLDARKRALDSRDDLAAPDAPSVPIPVDDVFPAVPIAGLPPVPTGLPDIPVDDPVQTTEQIAHTGTAPQAAAKTTGRSSCTPSPTKSLAPSATWTTCPYIARDGKVNPDVRNLNGAGAINDAAQSILYNAVTYSIQQTAAASKNAASFIDAFFLASATRMNPNMNFGQLIRGPGADGQMGTFTGILDLRGIVKIANAILLLKASKSPDWTAARDSGMAAWTKAYSGWLQTSDIGKRTASRPNNHLTFYVAQLSALKVLIGDNAGSSSAVQGFFSDAYLDQVAKSGEQPFEAVRTRPYHYRCFNLEALITNAKIGDQLGLNLWASKSKYGATIQTALDYTMALNPKGEDVAEILPHVASIAAAYGDPTGKYAAFLKKNQPGYQSKSYWYYDQTTAYQSSPAFQSAKKSRSVEWARDDATATPSNATLPAAGAAAPDAADIPFQCPGVFDKDKEVEISDGVFVTCDQLKPFYEIAGMPVDSSAAKTAV